MGSVALGGRAGLLDGFLEAFRILADQGAEAVARRIQQPAPAQRPRRRTTSRCGDVVAELVRLVDEAAGVTAHARQSVLDGPVRPFRIADDGRRPLVEPPPLAVGEHVSLQSVGQAEDELTAVVLERAGPFAGTEWIGEEVLLAGVAAEVVTPPVDRRRWPRAAR